MSDPTFWTPPSSPKFVGGVVVPFDDLENDLFRESEIQSDPFIENYLPYGLVCNSFTDSEIFEFYDSCAEIQVANDHLDVDNSIWSRLLVLDSCTENIPAPSLKHLRNDLSFILKRIFGFRFDKDQLVDFLTRMRSILVQFGSLCEYKAVPHDLIHIKLEIWFAVIRILESAFQNSELSQYANLALGLERSSVPNAYGYLVDILCEHLIHLSAQNNPDISCPAINNLWSLVVRYYEKFQSGWFKYLHGKMTKLANQRKTSPFEPRSLERLRPTFGFLSASHNKREYGIQCSSLWAVYWSVLSHTAAIHQTYSKYAAGTEVSSSELQKYSVAVWLIRKQILGEAMPSERDLRSALLALSQLFSIWGPSIEVIRTLWLHFSRRLNQGLMVTAADQGMPNACVSDTSFSDWLSAIRSADTSTMNSFGLFCSLIRTIPTGEIQELKPIFKVALPCLTRQVVPFYFDLIGHLLDEVLSRHEADGFASEAVTGLIDLLWDGCPAGLTVSDLQNWDTGRRCCALRSSQHLILLFRHHWIDGGLLWNEQSPLSTCFSRLVRFTKSIRNSLSNLWCADGPAKGTGPNRLSSMGWLSEYIQSTVQFGLDLLETPKTDSYREILHWIAAYCLDRTFFESLDWMNQNGWIKVSKALITLMKRGYANSTSTPSLQELLWSDIYPHLRSRTSRHSEKAAVSPQCAVELASVCREFILWSSMESSNSQKYQVPHPLTMLEYFCLDSNVVVGVRFALTELCFSSNHSIEQLINGLVLKATDLEDVAWRFLVLWLVFCLLIRPICEDRLQGCINSSYIQSSVIGTQTCAHFPPDLALLFSETDPELSLINISIKFDQFPTFHARMAYKSLVTGHLSRLCSFLRDCSSVSSSAKEENVGLTCSHLPEVNTDTICSVSYRAVSLLLRHCAPLLYSPGVASPLERLVDSFFLPRQLYEWEKLQRLSEVDPLPMVAIECMKDKLPELLSGLAQLPWRSDPYVNRVVRDAIRLYFARFTAQCVATAIMNSPTPEFRQHLIQLASREVMDELVSPVSEKSKSPSVLIEQAKRRSAIKWITFCKCLREDHEQWNTDKLCLAGPLRLISEESKSKNWFDGQLRTEFRSILNEITCDTTSDV